MLKKRDIFFHLPQSISAQKGLSKKGGRKKKHILREKKADF
jgi:hypothetical protein